MNYERIVLTLWSKSKV